LYIQQKTNLFDGKYRRVLHIAPENSLAALFQSTDSIGYLSADLTSTAMVQMDITDIHYPDNSFDVIYCSHVLEHVPEDRKAMAEFCRVLKPDGWAILQVPITVVRTIEDPTVTSPVERERLYGQDDHVRRYGLDYRDRLVGAGFKVMVHDFVQELGEATTRRYGLRESKDAHGDLVVSEDIYLCQKPGA